MVITGNALRGLHAEGTSAAAGGFHVRIAKLKTGPFHGLDVIDFSAVQIQKAGLIHKHLQAIVVVCLIEHVGLVFKGHRIAEPGTTATHDCDSQSGRLGILRREDLSDLFDSTFRQLHHFSKPPPLF